jgi:hypothetical protein
VAEDVLLAVWRRALVVLTPGVPDLGMEPAAVGHRQADAAGPGADLGSGWFRGGGVPGRDGDLYGG